MLSWEPKGSQSSKDKETCSNSVSASPSPAVRMGLAHHWARKGKRKITCPRELATIFKDLQPALCTALAVRGSPVYESLIWDHSKQLAPLDVWQKSTFFFSGRRHLHARPQGIPTAQYTRKERLSERLPGATSVRRDTSTDFRHWNYKSETLKQSPQLRK